MTNKATINTYYQYGNVNYNGVSIDRYDTLREAEEACIASMKRQKESGYAVSDQAIIEVVWTKVYNDNETRMEQTTKRTLEIIDKSNAEEEQ